MVSENTHKTVLLLTSVKTDGHTATLADAFIKGVKENNGNIEKIHVGGMSISDCRGCNGCVNTPGHTCVIDDEMIPVIEKIRVADTVVFASPVYFGNFNAVMKAVIDRLYCLNNDGYVSHRCALLMTAEGGEITFRGNRKNLEPGRYSYRSAIGYMNWEDKGIVIAMHVESNEDVIKSCAYSEAYELGKALA